MKIQPSSPDTATTTRSIPCRSGRFPARPPETAADDAGLRRAPLVLERTETKTSGMAPELHPRTLPRGNQGRSLPEPGGPAYPGDQAPRSGARRGDQVDGR